MRGLTMRQVGRRARGASLAAALLGLTGCVSLDDAGAPGDRWVLGLVHQKVARPDAAGSRMVSVTTVGLALAAGAGDSSGVTLGYNKDVVLKLGKNACVDLMAAGVCTELATATALGARP